MVLIPRILIDASSLEIKEEKGRKINKLQYEEDDDDFSNIIIKNIKVREIK